MSIAVRVVRRSAGMTLGRAAEVAGVSISYLSRVENGKVDPSGRWLYKFLDAMGEAVGSADIDIRWVGRAADWGAVSYDLDGAAALTGIKQVTISRAADRNQLVSHRHFNQRVFLAADLDEWVRSLPTQAQIEEARAARREPT